MSAASCRRRRVCGVTLRLCFDSRLRTPFSPRDGYEQWPTYFRATALLAFKVRTLASLPRCTLGWQSVACARRQLCCSPPPRPFPFPPLINPPPPPFYPHTRPLSVSTWTWRFSRSASEVSTTRPMSSSTPSSRPSRTSVCAGARASAVPPSYFSSLVSPSSLSSLPPVAAALEHTSILGPDLTSIAGQKSGIIKVRSQMGVGCGWLRLPLSPGPAASHFLSHFLPFGSVACPS